MVSSGRTHPSCQSRRSPARFWICVPDLQTAHEFMKAVETFIKLLHGSRIRNPNMVVRAERFARRYSHVSLFQKLAGEVHAVLDTTTAERGRYIGVSVKRSPRLCTLHTWDCAQSLEHKLAAFRVFGQHDTDRFLRPAQRLESGFLRNRSRVRRGMALKLYRRIDYFRMRQNVANAPPSHRIGL